FSPHKAVFTAIGFAVEAALRVRKENEAMLDALDMMECHLRIIDAQPDTSINKHEALHEASINLLIKVLDVLGLVTELQSQGFLERWVAQIHQSGTVASALNDLGRLATQHHQTVSVTTLSVAQRTLDVLTDSSARFDDEDFLREHLARIAEITQETYNDLRAAKDLSQQENVINRSALESIQDTLLRLAQVNLEGEQSKHLEEVCRWLQYRDCSARTNSLLYTRAKGSGSWFLDGAAFDSFKNGETRMLWLHGIAGCGKSTIMAGAMRELKTHCAVSQGIAVAHFFDATAGSPLNDRRDLISSLLCQIVHHRKDCLADLVQLYENNMSGKAQAPLDDLQFELSKVLRGTTSRTFIIIDAIDEAEDEDLPSILEELCALNSVSFLISSRSEVACSKDLKRLSNVQLRMNKQVVARDIATHLDGAFAKNGILRKVKKEHIELVRSTLENGARGNFRLLVLQINELAKVASVPKRLLSKLKDMPKTLSDTYARALGPTAQEDRDEICRLVGWLLFSRGPLTKKECIELLAMDFSQPAKMPVFETGLRLPSSSDIFEVVSSTFISYLDNYIRISHASVSDFFRDPPASHDSFRIEEHIAFSDMALMCMAYVSCVGYDQCPKEYWKGYPFYYHASRYWSFYADKALELAEHKDIEEEIFRFTENIPREDTTYLHLAFKERHMNVLRLLVRVPDLFTAYWKKYPAGKLSLVTSRHFTADMAAVIASLGVSYARIVSPKRAASPRQSMVIPEIVGEHISFSSAIVASDVLTII
ncbi:hypothetical protein EV122DRAFT_226616, partial [Schizophyllum commune]